MKYYSAMKRNQVFIHTTWMNVQGSRLSEKSQFVSPFMKYP